MDETAPSLGKLAIKFAVLCFMILFILILVYGVTSSIRGEAEYGTDSADDLRRCDRDYYEENYGELYETIALYKLYDTERYGKYLEVVNGANDYYLYVQWKTAADKGYEGAASMSETCKGRVEKNETECVYDENREVLHDFVMKTEAE
ncbi:MAG: hypothetical protein K6G07_07045 [Lachnospiraceae bacterium]|nr:hypothetical protein [Lachnospiraceae bacterium]